MKQTNLETSRPLTVRLRQLLALSLLSLLVVAFSAPAGASWDGGATGVKGSSDKGQPQVTICHVPPGNPSNAHTITVGRPAVRAHMRHGDYMGACSGETDDDGEEETGQSGEPEDEGEEEEEQVAEPEDEGEEEEEQVAEPEDEGEEEEEQAAEPEDEGEEEEEQVAEPEDEDEPEEEEQAAAPEDEDEPEEEEQAAAPEDDPGTDGDDENPFSAPDGPCAHLFQDGAPTPGFHVTAAGNLDGDEEYSYFYRSGTLTPDCRIIGPPKVIQENELE